MFNLLSIINKAIRTCYFIKYVTPPILKYASGRLFVFRHTPTWVVKEVAEMSDIDDEKELKGLQIVAQEELRLRKS